MCECDNVILYCAAFYELVALCFVVFVVFRCVSLCCVAWSCVAELHRVVT